MIRRFVPFLFLAAALSVACGARTNVDNVPVTDPPSHSANHDNRRTVTIVTPTSVDTKLVGEEFPIEAHVAGRPTRVQLTINGNEVAALTETPYRGAYTARQAGAYTIVARADFSDGTRIVSAPVTFQVHYPPDDQPLTDTAALSLMLGKPLPLVVITQPKNGAVVMRTADVRFVALGAAENDRLQVVELLVDGKVVRSFTEPPFEGVWRPEATGRHTLTARIVDKDGRQSTSDPVSVIVDEASQ